MTAAPAVVAATDNKVKEVKGTYQYYVPRHIARDQAEQIALERAMIEAIAREFGTVLSLNTQMDMRSSKKARASISTQQPRRLSRANGSRPSASPSSGL